MNVSFPKCNQAGTEFVISTTNDLQEKSQLSVGRLSYFHFHTDLSSCSQGFTPFHWHNEL